MRGVNKNEKNLYYQAMFKLRNCYSLIINYWQETYLLITFHFCVASSLILYFMRLR